MWHGFVGVVDTTNGWFAKSCADFRSSKSLVGTRAMCWDQPDQAGTFCQWAKTDSDIIIKPGFLQGHQSLPIGAASSWEPRSIPRAKSVVRNMFFASEVVLVVGGPLLAYSGQRAE